MVFVWDERKNRQNVRKHGLSFADAHCLFEGSLLVAADVRQDYGEERYLGIGIANGRVAVIVFAQPARSEQLQYEEGIFRQGNGGAGK